MKYYRCMCGEYEAWGSLPPPACAWCDRCKTTPAENPSGHRQERISHLFDPQPVETDEGMMTLSKCRYCQHSRREIEEIESLDGTEVPSEV